MESKIATAIQLRHPPLALLWSDEKPANALQFEEGRWGCVMWLVVSALKGRPAVCDAKSFGCFGGGVGMGFGNQYQSFPGSEEGFCRFLSSGINGWAMGPAIAEMVRPFLNAETYDNFVHGERYLKTPEDVRRFVAALPITKIPKRYVLLRPLADLSPAAGPPRTVLFFADPDQLSALVVLANYARGGTENVLIPFAAGCQTIGIYPYREADADRPRAVVGLTDISARLYVRRQLGDHFLSFAMPYRLFQEMESNVAGSFLERPSWLALLAAKRSG